MEQPWGWQVASGSGGSSRGGPAGGQGQLAPDTAEPGPGAGSSLSQAAPSPRVGLCCSPGPAPSPPAGPGMTRRGRFLRAARASLGCVSCPALSLSPSLSASSRGLERTGTGSGQFPGRGRTPGAVAMGTAEQHHWLEDRQAGFLTSDCPEDSPREPSWGRGGDAARGEVAVGVKGLARGLAQGDTRKGEVKGHFFPKRLWGSASQEQTRCGAGSPPDNSAP